jgi:hypothetical protein
LVKKFGKHQRVEEKRGRAVSKKFGWLSVSCSVNYKICVRQSAEGGRIKQVATEELD